MQVAGVSLGLGGLLQSRRWYGSAIQHRHFFLTTYISPSAGIPSDYII